MRVHVQLDAGPDRAVKRAQEITETGVNGLFSFEGQHDVFLPLAAAASAVDTDLMTNIAVALPRSPLHLAHAAYDLQSASSGRFRLGLGSQVRSHVERRYGSTWSRPAARMRETVLAVKAILGAWQYGTELDFVGEFSEHTLMPPTFNPGPNAHGIPPVLMGALGPVMTRTAAEVADGLLVMPFHSETHFRERTLAAVMEGLRRSDRTLDDFVILPQVVVATGTTAEQYDAACRGARALLAFYASTAAYLPVLECEGWEGLQGELSQLLKTGRFAEMGTLIDDTMLDRLAVHGTPSECAAEVVRRFGDAAEDVCAYFPGYDVKTADLAELAVHLQDATSVTTRSGHRANVGAVG